MARLQLHFVTQERKVLLLKQIDVADRHLLNLKEQRKAQNWMDALIEVDKTIAAGVSNSHSVIHV
jgi:hypothetical protein